MVDEQKLRDRITRALLSLEMKEKCANDVAFHMTDWVKDFEELAAVWKNPAQFGDDQVTKAIYGFLAHVPNHLNAATKLVGMGPIEDVFGVGIFEEDKD
ncbi:MAG TPA: hypothetical protein VF240_12905 [Pyrinomonadaceae bacterium]